MNINTIVRWCMVLSSRREEGKKVSSGLHFTSNTKLAEILQQKELWRTLLYWLNATSTHLYFFINWQFIVKNSFDVFVCLLFQNFLVIFLMNAVVIFLQYYKICLNISLLFSWGCKNQNSIKNVFLVFFNSAITFLLLANILNRTCYFLSTRQIEQAWSRLKLFIRSEIIIGHVGTWRRSHSVAMFCSANVKTNESR